MTSPGSPAATGPAGNGQRRVPSISGPAAALHLIGLSMLAFVQPVLDLVGRQPAFFVQHRVGPLGLAGALLLLWLLPAGTLLVLAGTAGRVRPMAGRVAVAGCIGGLVAVVALPMLRWQLGLPELAGLGVSVIVGVAAAVAYSRRPVVRTYVSWLAAGALVLPVLFLSGPGARAALRSDAPHRQGTPAGDARLATPTIVVLFDELPLSTLLDPTLLDPNSIDPDAIAHGLAIDSRRFPAFARLAATATWFRNFTTNYTDTEGAVPTLLTGHAVVELRPTTTAEYPRNLLTALSNGHLGVVAEEVTRLAPAASTAPGPADSGIVVALFMDMTAIWAVRVLPSWWAAHWDVGSTWGGFWGAPPRPSAPTAAGGLALADDRVSRFGQFVDAATAVDGDKLSFCHVMLPHSPWQLLPSGHVYRWRGLASPPSSDNLATWLHDRNLQPALRRVELQRHVLQAVVADALLGLLMDRLESSGRFDETTLVVVSDHGRNFAPGGDGRDLEVAHDPLGVLRVPLLIKRARQHAPQVVDRNVESIDLLATLADASGLELSWQTEGESGYATGGERATKFARVLDGRRFELPGAWTDRFPALDLRREWLPGASDDELGLYRLGPYCDLVGRGLDELEVRAEPLDRGLVLGGAAALAEVSLTDSAERPVFYVGSLRVTREDRPDQLAFALNGVLAAVTETHSPRQGRGEFSVLVPESLLRAGPNRLQAFLITGDAGSPVLQPLSGL